MTVASLKQALGDCKRPHSSICEQQTSYEMIGEPLFYVFDEKDEEPVRVLFDKGSSQLNVINDSGEEVCLVKTDKCLFTDADRKCDCILFNSRQVYLVEIKSGKNRNERRKEAVKQFATTIKTLMSSNIDLDNHETKAIICFKAENTRTPQASGNSKAEEFRKNYNIRLEEGNKIVF